MPRPETTRGLGAAIDRFATRRQGQRGPKVSAPETAAFVSGWNAALDQPTTYRVRRNIHGHAEAVERDGYTVLILVCGTERTGS